MGDTDHNAATVPDPTWSPLITTPPFPEYIRPQHLQWSGRGGVVPLLWNAEDSVLDHIGRVAQYRSRLQKLPAGSARSSAQSHVRRYSFPLGNALRGFGDRSVDVQENDAVKVTHRTAPSGPSRPQRLIAAAMSSSSRDVGDGDTAATAPGCDTYSKSFTAPLLPWQSFPIIEEATAWAVVPDGCEGHSGSRAVLHAEISRWIHIRLHAAGMGRVHLDGGFA